MKLKDKAVFKIHGWMIIELKLKNRQLILYALLYQACLLSVNVRLSYHDIMNILKCSKPTAISTVDKLCKKGFINKSFHIDSSNTYSIINVNSEHNG